jgi:hypothetical protein
MTSRSQYKVTKNGSWQPYFPTMGVASGCRPGVRNQSELFNIQHLAKNYQDDRLFKIGEAKPTQSASACAFRGSSLIPEAGCDKKLDSRLTFSDSSRNSNGSLQCGLIPREKTTNEPHGSHPGRMTTSVLFSSGYGSPESLPESVRVPRRVNCETLTPPDNLAPGLCPFDEFSIQPRVLKRSESSFKREGCLGPGLVPLEKNGMPEEKRNDNSVSSSEDPTLGPYRRVYGIQLSDLNN